MEKKQLKYGDEIMFPFVKPDFVFMGIRGYSRNSETVLVKSIIDIDPNDQDELKYGLTKKTFKVIITPMNEYDQMVFGRERVYFSDIEKIVLNNNPQYEIAPYPQELLNN